MVFAITTKAQIYFSEDFESGSLPDGWKIISNASDGGYLFGTATELSSSFLTIRDNGTLIAATSDGMCNCDKSDDKLISKSFDLSDADNAVLSFDYFYKDKETESLTVRFSIDNGTTWSSFDQISNTTLKATNNDWLTYNIYMGQALGQSDVKLAFEYSDGGDWAYGYALDNVTVYKPESRSDVELTSIDLVKNYKVGQAIDISGLITNLGSDSVKSLSISYTDGTETFTDELTNLGIAPYHTYKFVHTNSYLPTKETSVNITVNVGKVNGQDDDDESNNAITKKINIWNDFVDRGVLLEEFSTELCVYCPPVGKYLGEIEEHNDRVHMMVHHAGFGTDDFTIPENEEMLALYNGGTFAPAGMVDRHYNGLDNDQDGEVELGPVFWPGSPVGEPRIKERLDVPSFVSVNIEGTADITTQELQLNVSGTFLKDFNDEIGVSLWIIEDGIFTANQTGALGNYVHHALIRDAISSTFGDALSTGTAKGDNFSADYTFTYDESWEKGNLEVVAFLSLINDDDVNKRTVLNATSVEISELEGYENIVDLTFKVDMIGTPNFNASADKVFLKGSFSSEQIEMTTNDSRYYTATVTVDGSSVYTYEYSTTATSSVLASEVVVDDIDILVEDLFTPVSVNDQALNEVKLYPNPVNNELVISNVDQVSQIVISNAVGQRIKTIEVSSDLIKVNTNEFEAGVYLVTLTGKMGALKTMKLIKQ